MIKYLLILLFPILSYASTLSTAANSLSAGESIKITTDSLVSVNTMDGNQLTMWGNTGVWDSISSTGTWIGKRNSSSYPYRRMTYVEATNTWDADSSLHSDLTSNQSGHGYDCNAIDPTTGDLYFRQYYSDDVYKYTRSTSTWSLMSPTLGREDCCDAIEWWDGRGIVWSDQYGVELYTSSWALLVTDDTWPTGLNGEIGYHSIAEYNPIADIMIIAGGDNDSDAMFSLDADDNLSALTNAPFGLGNDETGQGILVYDPASEKYIAWNQANSWSEYIPSTDTWNTLTQSSGDGSTAQTGTPNMTDGTAIAIAIREYDVIMFVGSSSNDVWLYKHTESGDSTGSYSGNAVQSFILTADTSAYNPFTLGLGFAKGDVTTPTLDITDYQVEVTRTWDDGSVKHAIISGQDTMTANTPDTITVYDAGTQPYYSALTESDIVTAAPTATVGLSGIDTVSLADELGSPVRTWITGQSMVEAHYQVDVADDLESNHLSVWFHVRYYSTGDTWIRTVVENGILDASTSNESYAPLVIIGTDTVVNQGSITHYAYTRWDASGWDGNDPDIVIDIDTQYLESSRLVPNYWKAASATALNGLDTSYAINSRASWTADMGATGYQDQIGLLPLWDAICIASDCERRSFKAVTNNARSINAYPIIKSDSSTNEPIKLTDYSAWNYTGYQAGGSTSKGAGSLTWDIAHHGSAGYLAYIITGDYYYLTTMQYQAIMCYLFIDYGQGNDTTRTIMPVQTRGIAWTHRTLGQLVGIAPDDSVSNELQSWLRNGIDYWESERVQSGMNTIGYLYSYEVDAQDYDLGHAAPWQQHFWVQTFGFLYDIEVLPDMTNLKAVRNYLYSSIVGILGGNGASYYCFENAEEYTIKIAASATGDPTAYFDSWGVVYDSTFGGPNTSCGNTMGGDINATAYWANLTPAIAYAVEDTASGAYDAWTRLTGATNWSTYESSGFDDVPIWGIYPRATPDTTGTPSATTPNISAGSNGSMTGGGTGKVRP